MNAKIKYSEATRNFRVFELGGHTLLANGYLLDEKGRPVIYRNGPKPSPLSPARRQDIQDFTSRPQSEIIELKEATWICRPNSGNYCHWLIHSLYKIYCLHTIGWKIPIVLDRDMLSKKWVSETLKIFDCDLVFFPSSGQVKTEKLFLTDADAATFDLERRSGLKVFAQFLLERISDESVLEKTPRRIHISRQRTKRKFANIKEVSGVFAKFGIVDVYLEELSVAQQMRTLNGADFVVAPHGAGLANIIFMRSGASVLEIQHGRSFKQDMHFPAVSADIGLNHAVIKGKKRLFSGKNADIRIDPVVLEEHIEKMLAS